MSNKETFLRHSHIISKLRKNPHSFEEIQTALENESGITGYDLTCSQRTFQRDVLEILSLYDIEIKFNRSRKAYEIVETAEENHRERLLETFEIHNALQLSSSFSNHLILEKRKPLGTHNMYGLLHAIKNKIEIAFEHEKYWDVDTEKQLRNVQPLALIEARYRWYLIANDLKDDSIKTFGLERISNLSISKKTFTSPRDYRPEKAFRHCFGIINPEGENPEKIVLSLTPEQGKYIQSLPLHHSQKTEFENSEECRISLYLIPTYDFEMELLSLGENVTVLEPESLRNSIIGKLKSALDKYD